MTTNQVRDNHDLLKQARERYPDDEAINRRLSEIGVIPTNCRKAYPPRDPILPYTTQSSIMLMLCENCMSLALAARQLPMLREAKTPRPDTLYRWSTVGARSRSGKTIRLEVFKVGGTNCTSMEALERFVLRLNDVEHQNDDRSDFHTGEIQADGKFVPDTATITEQIPDGGHENASADHLTKDGAKKPKASWERQPQNPLSMTNWRL